MINKKRERDFTLDTKLLTDQVIALSWFRCLMEEGYDFVNKVTGDIETNEITIYKHFQQNSGTFDLPAAKCSPKGLEKNILEVVGNLLIYNTNPAIAQMLQSDEFTTAIKMKIEKIRNRVYSGTLPS